jgi:hypothetical protein
VSIAMSRLTIPLALAALAVASHASAPTAGAAKVLSIGKATAVTKGVAKRDCRRDEDCESSNAANCRRLAPRRVSCVASNVGTDAEGAYQCDRLVIVRLKTGGGLKHAAGEPSCFRV